MAADDLGLIVGSGLERLALDVVATRTVTTPYGAPSGPLLQAVCGGQPITALARHGQPHTLDNPWEMVIRLVCRIYGSTWYKGEN